MNSLVSKSRPNCPCGVIETLFFWTVHCTTLLGQSLQLNYFNCHPHVSSLSTSLSGSIGLMPGGGPRVVVSTAAFHTRVWGSVPGLGGLKETKMFLPHPSVKVSIVGSLRDREVTCSASDRQDSNFESCVWRTVSSQSSHHPQEVLLAQFSLYVHKGGLKPDSFHFIWVNTLVLALCTTNKFIWWDLTVSCQTKALATMFFSVF